MPLTILPGRINPDRQVYIPRRAPLNLSAPIPTVGAGTGVFTFTGEANGFVTGVQMLNRAVVAGTDDAVELTGASADTDDTSLLLTAVGDHIAVRFTDLPYQNGAVISDARVSFTITDSAKNDAEGTWTAHDIDDSPTMQHGVNGDVDGRTKTTASVAWTTNDMGVNGTRITTPNLSAVINEVVARAGWAPGNNITLLYAHNSAADKVSFAAFDLALGLEATLYSEYRLVPQVTGIATGHFGFTGSAAGVVEEGAVSGSGTGLFGFTGAASGVPRVRGAATGIFGFTGAAAGVGRALGQATGIFGFVGTAAGVGRARGAGTGLFGFVGTAAGVPRVRGAGTGIFVFTGSAEGEVPIDAVTGQGTGLFGFTGTASGLGRTYGTATGVFGFVGAAAGVGRTPGQAVGAFGFAGLAVGLVRSKGVATGIFGFVGSAEGEVPFLGPIFTPPDRIEKVRAELRTLTVGAEVRVLVMVPQPEAVIA